MQNRAKGCGIVGILLPSMHYCDHPGLKKDRAAQTANGSSRGSGS